MPIQPGVGAPLVSILIPVYNAEPWLAMALRSAFAQTWRRTEIIVVDDGSSDGSHQLARQFSSPSCLVVRQNHKSASAARNLAFSHAQGDFIQYLDADDLLGSRKIEAHLRSIDPLERDALSFGSITHFYDSSPRQSRSFPARCEARDGDPVQFLINLWRGEGTVDMVQTSQWLVPRRVVQRVGPWNESLTIDDDGEFFARVILESSRIVAVPKARIYYRKFRNDLSLSASENRFDSMRAAQGKCLALLGRTETEAARGAVQKIITREILRAFPTHPVVVRAGLDFLRWHGLKMCAAADGSPLYRAMNRLFGWKSTRWMQWYYRHWIKPKVADLSGSRAVPLRSAPEQGEESQHPPAPPLPAERCNPRHASAPPHS